MSAESNRPPRTVSGANGQSAEPGRPEQFPAAKPGLPLWPDKEILVPTDFTDHAGVALSHAILFAERLGARITLLHVIVTPLATMDGVACYPAMETVERTDWNARQWVGRICEREKLRPPILGETVVRMGIPCEAVRQTAIELNSDLIVVATHGRNGLSHVLFGSAAETIIRQAPCPVLVVRATAR